MSGMPREAKLKQIILDTFSVVFQDSAMCFVGFDTMLCTHILTDTSTV